MYLLLFINPFFIADVGFLYSFICSFTMIIINKFLRKNYFVNLIIITFYMTLFTLPITISLNYEINLMVFISNFLLIPFVSYILFPFALVTIIFNFLNPVFSFLTLIMEKIAYILSSVKITKLIVPKTSIIFIVIYYFILILFVYYNKKRFLIFLLSLLFIIKSVPFLTTKDNVIFLDVSQGDSMLYITKNQKKVYMFDTGGIQNKSISDNSLTYLKSLGINKIDYLILTHGDYDHMGDAINLVNNFKVKKVIFNCGKFNDLEKELIKLLDKKKIKYYSCIKELNIDNNKFHFLQTKYYDNENDNSNVIYTKLDGYNFLLMGDAGVEKEKDILDKYNLSNIDVLKVGHHGSKTSSSKNFISKINPKYSIISVGRNNRYGHPNKEVLNILKDSKIYKTDQNGSIMFNIKNNKLKIETCSP